MVLNTVEKNVCFLLYCCLLERLLVVSEYYERSFESLINEQQLLSVEQIQQWSHQILNALMYLQEKQLYARNLSLKNIRLTQSVNYTQLIRFRNIFFSS